MKQARWKRNGDIAHSAVAKQHRHLESAANLHCGDYRECESARLMGNKFAESEIIRDDKCQPSVRRHVELFI